MDLSSNYLTDEAHSVLYRPIHSLDLLKLLVPYFSPDEEFNSKLKFNSLEKYLPHRHSHSSLNRLYLETTSPSWRQELYQAALTGADERLTQLIEQLSSEHQFLAQSLTSMTVGFQFDQIIALFESG
jgi:hypothetical protein